MTDRVYKRKVGVVTLPGDFNYGNKLQLYAVQRIWRSLGYEAEQIVYRRQEQVLAHPKQALANLLSSSSGRREELRSQNRATAFDRFNSHIAYRKIARLSDINSESYSFFSVGSDQIWNPLYFGIRDKGAFKNLFHSMAAPGEHREKGDWCFLGFADRSQRVAMAPSIGVGSLDFTQSRWIADGVSNFDRVSVRETIGAELIKKCSGRDAIILCDPTLILSRKSWLAVADNRLTPTGSYVLAYLLGEDSEESKLALDCVTLNGSLPIVHLSDLSRPGELDAGPAEFLSLVAGASFVVTDSLHASVFSAIFERPLVIVRRDGTGAGIFSRMESLTGMLGIQDKIFDSDHFDASRVADYEGVSEAIMHERSRFMDYLRECMHA